jgi:serine/threonine-protein kinase RsbT
MTTRKTETLPVRSEHDVVRVRQKVREAAVAVKFNIVDQTKIVTAASELARNTLIHGGGGDMVLDLLEDGPRMGVRLSFSDQGPGIPDLALAMKEGYTTGGGLGLGLSGSKRLVSEFDIQTEVGKGTRVTVTRWK